MPFASYSVTLGGAAAFDIPVQLLLEDVDSHVKINNLYFSVSASIIIDVSFYAQEALIAGLTTLGDMKSHYLLFRALADTVTKLENLGEKAAWPIRCFGSGAADVDVIIDYDIRKGDIGQEARMLAEFVSNWTGLSILKEWHGDETP